MTFNAKLSAVAKAAAFAYADGNWADHHFIDDSIEPTTILIEISTDRDVTNYMFEDQEVEISEQGECTAKEVDGETVKLKFGLFRPIIEADLT